MRWLKRIECSVAVAFCVLASVAGAQASLRAPATWQLVRETTIGSRDGDDQYLFTKILTALPTERGSLVVADIAQRSVRLYDSSGKYVRAIGRRGAGPGEFDRLTQVGLIRDTVWVADDGLRRTTFFRLDGTLISSHNWESGVSVTPGDSTKGRNFLHALFADGSGWGENDAHVITTLRGGPELPKAVVRMTRTGRTRDTIAMVPTSHTMFVVLNDGGMQFGSQKFADGALTIGVSALSRLYVVHRAVATNSRTGNVRVIALRATGDTLWTRDLPYVPRPLEKSAADSFSSSIQRSLQRSGIPPDAIRKQLFIPEFRSPVSGAFSSDDGTLWLRREEGRATVDYWVIGPDGVLAANVSVPKSITLTAARGTQVWGEEKDSDDVPFVVRFRIAR